MGTMLKVFAVVLVVAGVWTWVSGRSVETDREVVVPKVNLSAGVAGAPAAAPARFDQEGTIVIDSTIGTDGTAFILYTTYTPQGGAQIETKRLVFSYRDACAEANLPCASEQPGLPVNAEDRVRVIGTVQDELVRVEEIYLI
ncbi:MAG TPA: hypothetical protein VGE53_01225 [Candidatus Paceibacterota bacterium]